MENNNKFKSIYKERISKFTDNSAVRFYNTLTKLYPEYDNLHEYTKEKMDEFVCLLFEEIKEKNDYGNEKQKFDIVKQKNFKVHPLNHDESLVLYIDIKEMKCVSANSKKIIKEKIIPFYSININNIVSKVLKQYEKVGSFDDITNYCNYSNLSLNDVEFIKQFKSYLGKNKDIKIADILDHTSENIDYNYKGLSRNIKKLSHIYNRCVEKNQKDNRQNIKSNAAKLFTIESYIRNINDNLVSYLTTHYGLEDDKYQNTIVLLVQSGVVNDKMFRSLDIETLKKYCPNDDIAKKIISHINATIKKENENIITEEEYNNSRIMKEELKRDLKGIQEVLKEAKEKKDANESKCKNMQDAYNDSVEKFIRKYSRL